MVIEGEFRQSFVFVCSLRTLVNFACFLISHFIKKKNLSEKPSECQTVVSRSGPTFYYQYV